MGLHITRFKSRIVVIRLRCPRWGISARAMFMDLSNIKNQINFDQGGIGFFMIFRKFNISKFVKSNILKNFIIKRLVFGALK